MVNALGGFRQELQSHKQYVYTPQTGEEIQCIERPIPTEPIIWQGNQLACVPCSIATVANFEKGIAAHDWQRMFTELSLTYGGTKPSEALEWARKNDWFKAYYEITNCSPDALRAVLRRRPIMIGLPVHEIMWAGTNREKPLVYDGVRDYGHMCVLWNVTPEGDWIVVNFAKREAQDWRVLSKDYPIDVAYFVTNEQEMPVNTRAGWLNACLTNARRLVQKLV